MTKSIRFNATRLGGALLWLLAVMTVCGGVVALPDTASAETRTLKLYYTHTREKAEITFKKNGRYVDSGLKKLNQFLRDWRKNEPTKMDPQLFDIVWETYQEVGAKDYIHVVSAYRSPATNAMLRKTRGGQAKKSKHMTGQAMDFYIPGVSTSKLREVGFKLQGGGVGYYPKSASPFVHLDTGSVRAWPRMSRNQLAKVFPDGKTLHLPAEGGQLPGYQVALAEYKSRKAKGIATAGSRASRSGGGNFLASLFGGGGGDEDETEESSTPSAPTRSAPARAPDPSPATLLAALPASKMPLPRMPNQRDPSLVEQAGQLLASALPNNRPDRSPALAAAASAPVAIDSAAPRPAAGVPLPDRRPAAALAAPVPSAGIPAAAPSKEAPTSLLALAGVDDPSRNDAQDRIDQLAGETQTASVNMPLPLVYPRDASPVTVALASSAASGGDAASAPVSQPVQLASVDERAFVPVPVTTPEAIAARYRETNGAPPKLDQTSDKTAAILAAYAPDETANVPLPGAGPSRPKADKGLMGLVALADSPKGKSARVGASSAMDEEDVRIAVSAPISGLREKGEVRKSTITIPSSSASTGKQSRVTVASAHASADVAIADTVESSRFAR